MAERAEKLETIREMLSGLYCFTSDEIDGFVAAAEFFPEDGLDKFISLLQDGKKQQDDFLTHRVEADKNYVKNLSKFLKKTTDTLKGQYEKTERAGAEKVLDEI